jgi:hypothetical protein
MRRNPRWAGHHGISLINERLPTSQAAPLLTVAAASWIIWSEEQSLCVWDDEQLGLVDR